jgi:hypothetical protein
MCIYYTVLSLGSCSQAITIVTSTQGLGGIVGGASQGVCVVGVHGTGWSKAYCRSSRFTSARSPLLGGWVVINEIRPVW